MIHCIGCGKPLGEGPLLPLCSDECASKKDVLDSMGKASTKWRAAPIATQDEKGEYQLKRMICSRCHNIFNQEANESLCLPCRYIQRQTDSALKEMFRDDNRNLWCIKCKMRPKSEGSDKCATCLSVEARTICSRCHNTFDKKANEVICLPCRYIIERDINGGNAMRDAILAKAPKLMKAIADAKESPLEFAVTEEARKAVEGSVIRDQCRCPYPLLSGHLPDCPEGRACGK